MIRSMILVSLLVGMLIPSASFGALNAYLKIKGTDGKELVVGTPAVSQSAVKGLAAAVASPAASATNRPEATQGAYAGKRRHAALAMAINVYSPSLAQHLQSQTPVTMNLQFAAPATNSSLQVKTTLTFEGVLIEGIQNLGTSVAGRPQYEEIKFSYQKIEMVGDAVSEDTWIDNASADRGLLTQWSHIPVVQGGGNQ